jgi:hypothetical protein
MATNSGYDFIIDLSNVCRSEELGAPSGGASLKCMALLEKAIARHLDGRSPVLFFIADKSLWPLLKSSGTTEREINDWKLRRQKWLVENDVADGPILRMASTEGGKVITRDTYRDHRRLHPWLQNNSEDFFGWARVEGQIVLVPRILEALSESDVSRFSEQRDMKSSQLDVSQKEDQRILESLYQCQTVSCVLRQANPSYLPKPPNRRRREPSILECPQCREPVREIGHVGRVAQFKFKILETGHTGRITFKVDSDVLIGRQDFINSLSSPTDDDREIVRSISGQHLLVHVSPSVCKVADNNSSNGTEISRLNSVGTYSAPVPLSSELVGLNLNDKVYLGGVIELMRSGRRYGFANLTEAPTFPNPGKTEVR